MAFLWIVWIFVTVYLIFILDFQRIGILSPGLFRQYAARIETRDVADFARPLSMGGRRRWSLENLWESTRQVRGITDGMDVGGSDCKGKR